jgi:hypothetical protein
MICAKCADRRSPSEKCDRQACAASWFIAPTISARMREGSARIDGRTIFDRLILNRYSYVRRVADDAPISGLTGTGTGSQRLTAPYRRSRAARHSKNSSKSFLRASADAGTASRRSVRNRLNSLAFVRRGRSAAFPLPATSIAKPNPVRSAPTRLSTTSEHIAEHSFPSKN